MIVNDTTLTSVVVVYQKGPDSEVLDTPSAILSSYKASYCSGPAIGTHRRRGHSRRRTQPHRIAGANEMAPASFALGHQPEVARAALLRRDSLHSGRRPSRPASSNTTTGATLITGALQRDHSPVAPRGDHGANRSFRSTIAAPAGTGNSPALPTCTIRPFLTRNAPFSTEVPSPTITRFNSNSW
jgi:hypothetical protein